MTTETPDPTPESSAPAKRTRGPTRAALRAVDLVERIAALDAVVRADIRDKLDHGVSSIDVKAEVKAKRQEIRDAEVRIRDLETAERMLSAYYALPDVHQRIVLASLDSVEQRTE